MMSDILPEVEKVTPIEEVVVVQSTLEMNDLVTPSEIEVFVDSPVEKCEDLTIDGKMMKRNPALRLERGPLQASEHHHVSMGQEKEVTVYGVTLDESNSDGDHRATGTCPEGSEEELLKLRKRFLLQLIISLHSYGDTTHRTEYLMAAVSEGLLSLSFAEVKCLANCCCLTLFTALHVRADVGAFPNFALVSFLSQDDDPTKSELHHLPISGGLDVDKLARVDELCQV